MAIHAQILIGSRKDEEAIDWSKGFGEAFIGQGKNKLKEVMEAYQGREDLCVFGEERRRKRRMKCEKGC
jgi:hypothetical protein